MSSAAGAPGAPAQLAAASQPRLPMPPPSATAAPGQHHSQMRPMLPQPGSAVSMRPPPAMQHAVPQGQQPLPTGAWLGPMTGPTARPPGGVPAGLPPGVAQMQATLTPQQAAAYNQQLMQQHQLRMLQQQAFAAQQQQQQLQQQQQRPPAQHQQQMQAQIQQPQQPPQPAAQAAQAPQRALPAQPVPSATPGQGLPPPVPQPAPSVPASAAYVAGPPAAMQAPVQSGAALPAGYAALQAQQQQQMQQQQQAAYLQQQQQQQQPRPYLPASSLAPPQGSVVLHPQPPFNAAQAPNGVPATQQMPPPSSTVALSQAQLLQRVQYFQAMQVRSCGIHPVYQYRCLLTQVNDSCSCMLPLRRCSSIRYLEIRNLDWRVRRVGGPLLTASASEICRVSGCQRQPRSRSPRRRLHRRRATCRRRWRTWRGCTSSSRRPRRCWRRPGSTCRCRTATTGLRWALILMTSQARVAESGAYVAVPVGVDVSQATRACTACPTSSSCVRQ